MNSHRATTIADVQQFVQSNTNVLAHGSRTKPALCRGANLDMTALAGVTEYEPGEFTFTALAGTRLSDIAAMLAGHGQYLPFDPPLVDAGATLGGTVAAGLSGPGRLRFGGVRDFVIGVRLVDGAGTLVHGGGKVVKNAAGFDLPKLMVGSAGRLGVIVELTMKVFPEPRAHRTWRVRCANLADAIGSTTAFCGGPHELEALDLEPPNALVLRIGGPAEALDARAARLPRGELLDDLAYWRTVREFAWVAPGQALVKAPLTPRRIAALDERLQTLGATRRYSVAGNVAWIAIDDASKLDAPLREMGLSGLVLRGDADRVWLGVDPIGPFARRVRAALDPQRRLVEW